VTGATDDHSDRKPMIPLDNPLASEYGARMQHTTREAYSLSLTYPISPDEITRQRIRGQRHESYDVLLGQRKIGELDLLDADYADWSFSDRHRPSLTIQRRLLAALAQEGRS